MAPSSCLHQRLCTDVTSDTERHFHFRAVGRGFEDVWRVGRKILIN